MSTPFNMALDLVEAGLISGECRETPRGATLRRTPDDEGFHHFEDWSSGRPGQDGALDQATASDASIEAADLANANWSINGVDAANATCPFGTDGGVVLTTHTTSGDQCLLRPRTDSGFESFLGKITWNTALQPYLECLIKTSASQTLVTAGVGFKISGTLDTGTDADQAYFRFAGTGAEARWSATGTDGGSGTVLTAANSTIYRLKVWIDSDRVAHFEINGREVAASAVLTSVTTLKPIVGIQTLTGALTWSCYWIKTGQRYAA